MSTVSEKETSLSLLLLVPIGSVYDTWMTLAAITSVVGYHYTAVAKVVREVYSYDSWWFSPSLLFSTFLIQERLNAFFGCIYLVCLPWRFAPIASDPDIYSYLPKPNQLIHRTTRKHAWQGHLVFVILIHFDAVDAVCLFWCRKPFKVNSFHRAREKFSRKDHSQLLHSCCCFWPHIKMIFRHVLQLMNKLKQAPFYIWWIIAVDYQMVIIHKSLWNI